MQNSLKTFGKFVLYSVLADLGVAAHFGTDSLEKMWPLLVAQVVAGVLKALATYASTKLGPGSVS